MAVAGLTATLPSESSMLPKSGHLDYKRKFMSNILNSRSSSPDATYLSSRSSVLIWSERLLLS
jgi:hypothetical protein